MILVNVRESTQHDIPFLLKIPQYSQVTLIPEGNILVAESNGDILGATNISQRDFRYIPGEWNNNHENLNGVINIIRGSWISRLYVFPEYRLQGIGTKLVKAAIKYQKCKGFKEVYSGIYIKNESRQISLHIFKKCGFTEIGTCICSLPKGHCFGTLLKKSLLDESE